MPVFSNLASPSRAATATDGLAPELFMWCRRCRYQPCQDLCHVGVTPGEVLISGHTIKLDEITMGASVHWSAILYSILADNLEVPIISWMNISVLSCSIGINNLLYIYIYIMSLLCLNWRGRRIYVYGGRVAGWRRRFWLEVWCLGSSGFASATWNRSSPSNLFYCADGCPVWTWS